MSQEERHKDLHFDAWLVPAEGSPLAALVDELFAVMPLPPITPGRKHRADALQRRKDVFASLIANIAAHHLSASAYERLALPLRNSKRTRYERRGFAADVLREQVVQLEERGLVALEAYRSQDRRTGAVAGSLLARHFDHIALDVLHLDRVPGAETIELSQTHLNDRDEEVKTLVDYTDTDETSRMRAEMGAINAAMHTTDIRFGDAAMPPINAVRKFSDTFDRHGRFYCGWFQNRKREERHLFRLAGEPVADLDFKACFVQLAYWKAGAAMLQGDPYALEGLEDPAFRDAVKRTFSSLFFRKTPAKRLPKGVGHALPKGTTMQGFKAKVVARHPAISALLDTNVGFLLYKAESDILADILLQMRDQQIPVMFMHDGVMVPQSRKLAAMSIMRRSSKKILGRTLDVVEKPVSEGIAK